MSVTSLICGLYVLCFLAAGGLRILSVVLDRRTARNLAAALDRCSGRFTAPDVYLLRQNPTLRRHLLALQDRGVLVPDDVGGLVRYGCVEKP